MHIRDENRVEILQIGVEIRPNDANQPKVWKRAVSMQIRRESLAEAANKTVMRWPSASPNNV